MKIIKKLCAAMLSVSILSLSCMLPCAFAESQRLTDNFDDEKLRKGFSKYPSETYNQTSDVFENPNGGAAGFGIEAPDGEGTNQVLRITHTNTAGTTRLGDYVTLKTKTITREEGQVIRFSYDINFKEIAEAILKNDEPLKYLYLLRNGAGGFAMNETSNSNAAPDRLQKANTANEDYFIPEIDKWYKVIAIVGTDNILRAYIVDSETGEVMLENAPYEYSGNSYSFTAVRFEYVPTFTGRTLVHIDNAEIYSYYPAEEAAVMTSATVEDGFENVPRNNPLKFTFDQPVSGSIILKKGEDVVENTVTTPNAIGSELTLTYDGLLERDTTYTLSFENVTNAGGIPCDDITFTTEDLHLWNDIENISASVNSTDSTKTDITFTLSEEYGYESFDGGIMAMLYRDKKMLGVDMVSLINQDVTSSVTKSFSFGVTPNAGDEIKLMLADMVNGFVPLAGGSCQYGN